MEKTQKVFNLIVLDESGSMETIKASIISGFNELIQSVQGAAESVPEQQHLVTMVTFNGLGIKTLFENEDVKLLRPIDARRYRPNSMTPLYDALGDSITRLKKVSDLIPDCRVLVTIMTDGAENASREYSGQDIKKMIDDLKTRNWTFTYIGTEHDVEQAAFQISIENVLCFSKSEEDMTEMFHKERKARRKFYSDVQGIRASKNTDFFDEEDEHEDPDSASAQTAKAQKPEKK